MKICSGVTPAVVATVYKLKLLNNSRKDNFFSKKTVGYLNYYLQRALLSKAKIEELPNTIRRL